MKKVSGVLEYEKDVGSSPAIWAKLGFGQLVPISQSSTIKSWTNCCARLFNSVLANCLSTWRILLSLYLPCKGLPVFPVPNTSIFPSLSGGDLLLCSSFQMVQI